MPSEASINAELSAFAVALFYQNNDLVANQIAPVIPVDVNPGEYHVLTPIEGKNLNEETAITHGGKATELNFKVDKNFYSTKLHGKRHYYGAREEAMSSAALREYRKGIQFILENLALKREDEVADIILEEDSYYSDADNPHWFAADEPWDSDDYNPYHDIKAAMRAIALHSGRTANTLLVPPKVYDVLADNDKFIDILKGLYGLEYIKTGKLPNPLFGLNVIKAGAVYNENPPLETASMQFLWEAADRDAGSEWAWVGYVDPNPSLQTSAMVLQFAFDNNIIGDMDIVTVRSYYENDVDGTWYEARTDYDIRLSNGRAGALIYNTISES